MDQWGISAGFRRDRRFYCLRQAARGGEADAPDFVASGCIWAEGGRQALQCRSPPIEAGQSSKGLEMILEDSNGINM